jgi:integrase
VTNGCGTPSTTGSGGVDRPGLPQHGPALPAAALRARHASGSADHGRHRRLREGLLDDGRLSRRTIQKILVLLHGILKRAKRKKWIASNPAEDAERITLRRSGDFNVLSPAEIEAVAPAARDEQDAAIFLTAAYTGLRMGELRALRWADVDFAGERILVRKDVTRWEEGQAEVRSRPLRPARRAGRPRRGRAEPSRAVHRR